MGFDPSVFHVKHRLTVGVLAEVAPLILANSAMAVVKYASDLLSAATPWEGCRTSWLQGRRAAAVGTCSAFGGTRESIYLYGRRYCGNVSDVKNTFNLWWWRA